MKKIISSVAVLGIVLLVNSCVSSGLKNEVELNRFEELKNAAWLVGFWKNESKEVYMSEIWKLENDSTFTADALYIMGKDTLSSETIVLEQRGKELFYIPSIKGQNNDKTVEFKLTSSTSKSLVFENKTHDFPQKISYTQITSDSITAEVSGKENGKASSIFFSFSKQK